MKIGDGVVGATMTTTFWKCREKFFAGTAAARRVITQVVFARARRHSAD
jgi:hypothetical protein